MRTEPEPIAEPAAVSEEKEEIQTVDTTVEDKIEDKLKDKLKDKPEELPVIVIGEAFRTYIIVQQGESIFLVDKHAAHERMLFNELVKTIPSVPLRCF